MYFSFQVILWRTLKTVLLSVCLLTTVNTFLWTLNTDDTIRDIEDNAELPWKLASLFKICFNSCRVTHLNVLKLT